MTIARYDAHSANTNRHVTFSVADAGGPTANTFFELRPNPHYPPYHRLAGTPTDEQELGQLRLNLVVRALSAYTVPVRVDVNADNSVLELTFEADEHGAYFNQRAFTVGGESWPLDDTDDKHHVEDITDFLGTGGMPFGPKTKNGLQSLADTLNAVSYDGGTTGPFGALSGGASIVLPSGVAVTTGVAAPTLAGGLVVAWVR